MFNKLFRLSDNKILLVFFLLALTVRLIYSVYAYVNIDPNDPELFNNLYYFIAQDIVEQGTPFYQTDDPYKDVVGPVMPWLNAIGLLISGDNWIGIFLVSALFSTLIVFYIIKTALLISSKAVAILAGIVSSMNPLYLHFTATPGKDIVMTFFIIYLIHELLYLFEYKTFSYLRFVMFTMMFVISFHLDERFLIFAPFILLFILLKETGRLKKCKVRKSLLFIVFVIVLMIPWTVHNINKFDKVVILTTRTEKYTDQLFGYEKNEPYFSEDFTDIKGLYYIHDYQIDSVISGKKTITDAGYNIPPLWVNVMKEGKMPGPLTGFNAFLSRIVVMYEPFQWTGRWVRTGYYYEEYSFRHNLISFLFYGIFFLMTLPGFYFFYLRNRTTFYLFISTIIIYTIIHSMLIPYTVWRYRLPLDALFIIVGIFGFFETIQRLLPKVYFKLYLSE
jgi:4-amino-4-deoxy-L-arabinose transferase-like glycosyltransferase